MKPWRPAPVLGVLVLALAVVACGGDDDDDDVVGCSGGTFDVTVTLPMFAEFACTVGGDHVNVRSLMPLTEDPHSYVPPEDDAELVSNAKLILYAGLGLDEPLQEFIFTHGRGSAQLIAYSRSITSPTVQQPPDDQPRIDAEEAGDNPYLWLDPELAIGYVDVTRDSLEIVDPENISDYREEFASYTQRIFDLQSEINGQLQAIPAENRKLFTLHESMEHLARAFGFEVIGHLNEPGETPDEENIAAMVEVVQAASIPAIFTEVGYDTAAIQELATAAGVELCALYTDRADANASVYEDMMRANAAELVRCLAPVS